MHQMDEFIRGLMAAVQDEQEAVEFYGRLAKMAPNPWMRKQIEMIQADEARHAGMFSNMINTLMLERKDP